MKNFKNLSIYLFATIGFIVIACGGSALVDDVEDETAVLQSNNGKYQFQYDNASRFLIVMNTETGKVRTYRYTAANPNDKFIQSNVEDVIINP